jgi:hypothetical protein
MKQATRVAVLAGLMLAATQSVWAQDAPKTELAAGYNMLKPTGDESEALPAGWFGEIAGNITPMLGIVGQMTANYKGMTTQGVDVDTSIMTFAAGLRFSGRSAAAVPFGQILFGVARSSASSSVAGLDISDSSNNTLVQVGAGVNLMPQAPIGLRVGGDYLRVLGDDGGNAFRFALGIVVPLGR